MALRDALAAVLRRRPYKKCVDWADDVLVLLTEHRDEVLSMLLAPDESVRRDGEVRDDWGVVRRWVERNAAGEAGAVEYWLVPVSDAEPRRVPADCPHDTFAVIDGLPGYRCTRCRGAEPRRLGSGAERGPSGEDDDHG